MFSSTVIATVVTYFSTKKLKVTEFSYDYKKYLVEKRKKAYSKVEEVIHQYQAVKQLMDSIFILSKSKLMVHDATAFQAFRKIILDAKKKRALAD